MAHSSSFLKETLFLEKNWVLGAVLAGMVSLFCNWISFVLPFFGIILSNFTLLPLFMSGFIYGYKGFGVSSAIFLALPIVFFTNSEIIFASLCTLLPAAFAYSQSMRYRLSNGKPFFYPEGRLIISLICFLIVGFVVFFLSWQGISQNQNALSLEQVFFQFFNSFFKELPLKEMPDPRIIAMVSRFFPAIIGFSWFLVVFFNIHLALRLLAKWNAPLRRPSFVFEKMSIPSSFIWVLIGCSAFTWIKGDIGFLAQNSLGLILCAYGIGGIACVQFFFLHQKQGSLLSRKIFLGIFYISMVLFPWFLLIVAGLGIFDSLLGLKEKKYRLGQSKKD